MVIGWLFSDLIHTGNVATRPMCRRIQRLPRPLVRIRLAEGKKSSSLSRLEREAFPTLEQEHHQGFEKRISRGSVQQKTLP
jgi:hypothetical protein